MKLFTLGMLASSSLISSSALFGASGLTQGSALAVLSGTLWYVLARVFPAHIKAQQDIVNSFIWASKRERNSFLEAQKDSRESHVNEVGRLSEAVDRLSSSVLIGSVNRKNKGKRK